MVCDKNSGCWEMSIAVFVGGYACQLLNDKSDSGGAKRN